jgi:hypothetical protein
MALRMQDSGTMMKKARDRTTSHGYRRPERIFRGQQRGSR